MKYVHRLCRTALVFVALCAATVHASAQAPAVIHGDAAATIGWLSSHIPSPQSYGGNDWLSSLFGAGSVGWHWTDNLKSEIDFGIGTEASTYRSEPLLVAGRTQFLPVTARFGRRTIGLSQQYQFFHNVWFHPHAAVGVNLTWERRTEEYGPIYFYDDAGSSSRVIPSGREKEVETSLTVRPFAAVGFKAYVTDRVFFRNDLRIAFAGGPDETLIRLGFGIDF